MPDPEKIREHKSLGFMADSLGDPRLWTLTRSSVAGAFSIGIFVAFLPMPMQMLLAAALAGWFRVNLPISVGLVWLTNPITMPAIFYGCYRLGAWLMGQPVSLHSNENTYDWILTQFNQIWPPLLLGCVLAGTVLAVLSNLLIRLLWRWQVASSWKKRSAKRKDKNC